MNDLAHSPGRTRPAVPLKEHPVAGVDDQGTHRQEGEPLNEKCDDLALPVSSDEIDDGVHECLPWSESAARLPLDGFQIRRATGMGESRGRVNASHERGMRVEGNPGADQTIMILYFRKPNIDGRCKAMELSKTTRAKMHWMERSYPS